MLTVGYVLMYGSQMVLYLRIYDVEAEKYLDSRAASAFHQHYDNIVFFLTIH